MKDWYYDDDNFLLDDELSDLLETNSEDEFLDDLLDFDYMKQEYKRKVLNRKQTEEGNK